MKAYLSLAGLALLAAAPFLAQAQTGGVRIGTPGPPDASAALDLSPDADAAPKGLLPPRLTLAQRNAIASPATGLVVYQTDNVPGLYVYNGSIWALQGDNLGNHTATQNLNLGSNLLVGNGGTTGLGITGGGFVGLGTSTPYSQLANTSTNILGSEGNGGSGSSFAWVGRQVGYAAMIYNSSAAGGAGGLAVKVASTTAGALDISQGSGQLTVGPSLLRVLGSGNVGIGTGSPSQLLELSGQTAPTLLLHSTGNSLANGATLQFRENSLTYGWNLRHNTGGAEPTDPAGTPADDRLVLESVNSGSATPVMAWNQARGLVGIGTTAPLSQLANTSTNIVGSDSYGGSTSSLAWASSQFGYAGMIYNSNAASAGSGGLAIKTASTAAAALDVSQGTSQNTPGTPLLRVLGNGNVGIGTSSPAYKLDVTGDARVSGSLNLGLVTVSNTLSVSPSTLGGVRLACPSGTRLLGGGGGFRQFNASAVDIALHYNGPDPDNPTTAWLLYAQNTGTVARDVYITCNCARIQ